ncbi:MAG: hypothetical protein ACK5NN_13105 [Sphingomonadaceae bacterium]
MPDPKKPKKSRQARLDEDSPNRIRTMVWFDAVRVASGLPTAEKIEAYLEPEKVKRSGGKLSKWAKYRDGRSVPKDPSPQDNSIEIAEAALPGTARWFRSPIWKVLCGETISWIALHEHLFFSSSAGSFLFPDPVLFDGKPVLELDASQTLDCQSLDSIELIEAVVLLLERGREAQSVQQMQSASQLYEITTKKVARIPELARNYGNFLDAVERRFFPLLARGHDDPFSPWHVRLKSDTEFQVTEYALEQALVPPYRKQ